MSTRCSPRQSFGCEDEHEITSYVPSSHGVEHAVTLYIYTLFSLSLPPPLPLPPAAAIAIATNSASDVIAETQLALMDDIASYNRDGYKYSVNIERTVINNTTLFNERQNVPTREMIAIDTNSSVNVFRDIELVTLLRERERERERVSDLFTTQCTSELQTTSYTVNGLVINRRFV